MSLTSASTPTYRAGWAKASSLASGAAVVRHHHHQQQQTRGFRFGRTWSSYLDPEYTQDVCHRQRRIRYKYFQTLNRRLSWEQHPLAENAKSTIKRMSKDYWYPVEQENAGRRHLDEEIAASTINNPTGIRPGQNIEDAERAPLEDLLFGDAKTQIKTKAEAPLEKSKCSRGNKNKSKSVKADSEYVIDPITNRKVLKSATFGLDSNVPLSSPYTSQFTNLTPPELDASKPIFYDGPPPEAELKVYSQVKVDDAPWNPIDPASAPSLSDVLLKDTPAPDLLNALSSDQAKVSWHPNAGIAATTAVPPLGPQSQPVANDVSEAINKQEAKYEDLDKYGPVKADEPDGKYRDTPEVPADETELGKYGAVRSHEPDGKYKQASEDTVDKAELGQYGAVRAHEPDGKYKEQKEFTNTQEYDPAELAEYDSVRVHEPDGKYKKEKGVNNYDEYDPAELAEYGSVRAHEPDGLYKKEKGVNNYDEYDPAELAEYDAVRAHEPDGMYKKEKAVNNYDEYDPAELAEYDAVRAHEPDGMYKKEKAVNNYDEYDPAELAEYDAVRVHEPDGLYKKEKGVRNYDEYDPAELAEYDAVRVHEPDGMYKEQKSFSNTQEYDPAELAQYDAVRAHEPDGMYKKEKEFVNYSEYDPAELAGYGAFRAHEPDGMYKKEKEYTNYSEYEDLDAYGKPFLSHEPDGKYAAEMARAEPRSAPSVLKELRERQQPAVVAGLQGDAVDAAKFSEELSQYGAFRSHEPDGKYAASAQGQRQAHAAEEDTLSEENPLEAFTYEDAQTTKSSAVSKPQPVKPTTTSPTVYKILAFNPDTQFVEEAETTSSVLPSNSNTPTSPADVLTRLTNISKFLPHFARIESQGFEIVAGSGDVLVFRKVREGVTSPLQSQTVHEPAAARQAMAQADGTLATSSSGGSPINPVDMTGGSLSGGGKRDYHVATGRFASPTGFVNYNLPSSTTTAANPSQSQSPSSASEKVHYEQAAAETQQQQEQKQQQEEGEVGQQQRKKASLTKRAVMGAAWIAGGAYSVGVVRDFFKTGGVDGKGSKGL
ncbi:hypothetical protein NCU06536 [Neurospora crassa OR74A]|uniref:Serine-threonine rich protein n=1 Tax=Neurospora crassa (strain ATCC 24698 / 74-OR23-1A / CBS 708.71 / DSM 1257 / FGSC 987) TaxID=367110 RepID=V5IPW6_NEUCR|nr:hypothetical protein NCU06536 [Neurospora crassa OR74A]ESA42811.1 hypothetical protein NCU06536 [Neurospora crassa OR74A]|eukprot:XP_011394192.1 hypothetical protein NCU06536 [Neurospora crassa OR74A]